MVHANLYVLKKYDSRAIRFLPRSDGTLETLTDAVQIALPQLTAESVDEMSRAIDRVMGDADRIQALGVGADLFMSDVHCNEDMGVLLRNLLLEVLGLVPDGYSGTGSQWLRLTKYILHNQAGHAIGAAIEDHDVYLAACICGVDPTDYADIRGSIRTVEVDCTLKYDMRRNAENPDGNEHYVEHNGILDIQTLEGARFVESDRYNRESPSVSPTYVFDPVVTLKMLEYDGELYPDLRSSARVEGIGKVGTRGQQLHSVQMSDLYGRIDPANTITVRNDDGAKQTTYWLRKTDGDNLTGDPRPLYYHGHNPLGALRRDNSFIYVRGEKLEIDEKPDLRGLSFWGTNTMRTFYNTYDGTQDSVYQLAARFGTANVKDSVLGCPLPIKVTSRDGELVAQCAALQLGRGGETQVRVHNPQAVLPTHDLIANSLSRKGRRNEVGIALQLLTPSKQGDIVLYDGV